MCTAKAITASMSFERTVSGALLCYHDDQKIRSYLVSWKLNLFGILCFTFSFTCEFSSSIPLSMLGGRSDQARVLPDVQVLAKTKGDSENHAGQDPEPARFCSHPGKLRNLHAVA